MNKTTSPEIASMAGRILAAGDPLKNDQVVSALVEEIALANSLEGVRKALQTLLQPYIDNGLSLAGSCLAQAEPDSIVVSTEVDYEVVANAFTGAIESGHSSWLNTFWVGEDDLSATLKRAIQLHDGIWYNDPSYWRDGGSAVLTYDDPSEDEGDGNGRKVIGKADILTGLQLMAANSKDHFADLINDNDDAITHDVFVQYVVLGEIIYG